MTEARPEVFGRYQLLRRLAFGGMAEIFLATLRRDGGFEKKVVLKRILPQFGTDETFVRMFIDEAVLAARITHPNVVQIHDFGHVDGVYFIAMELIDGVDLRRVIRAERPKLAPAEVAAIGEGVARGLAYAHNLHDDNGAPLSIVHRDVSPHNVMISRAGETKLMDFGIAKAAARLSRTEAGTIKGKVAYMAPEQATGRPLDKRADQFALGLVLWECLVGERMFDGTSDIDILRRVAACDLRPLRAFRTDVPEQLERVIARSLQASPDARYPDCTDMAAELAAFRFSLGAGGSVHLGALADEVAPPTQGAGSGRRTLPLPEAGGQAAAGPGPATAGVAAGWPEADASEAPTFAGTQALAAGEAVSSPCVVPLSAPPSPLPSGRGWIAIGVVALAVAAAATLGIQLGTRRGSNQPGVATAEPVATAAVHVESSPLGASILLDGLDTGLRTPAVITGQELGTPSTLSLVLAGHAPHVQQLVPSSPREHLAVQLRPMPPAAAVLAQPRRQALHDERVARAHESPPREEPAVAERKARHQGKRARPMPPSSAASEPSAAARATAAAQGTGKLWLRSTGVWLDVYLDDRKLGTTPLSGVEVPAGRLRLRLVNSAAKVQQALDLDIEAGAQLRRTVTVR